MEYFPPPFFNQGPSALARVGAFALLSIALLLIDARYKLLETVRYGTALALYPLQVAARAPGEAASNLSGYFGRQQSLIADNSRLEREKLVTAAGHMRAAQLETENANLRSLIGVRERQAVVTVAAEILRDARDPFTRKVVIGKGTLAGIKPGQVVIDATGVVGQVTRAFPAVAEVSLLTDRDQAIPVQLVRNGLRAIAYGTAGGPDGGTMELRFLATNADVRQGDTLVTSGIDGTYLLGLPVATVIRIEREAGYAFARIVCKPTAGIDRYGHVLVLTQEKIAVPSLPPEGDEKPGKGKRKKMRTELMDKGAARPATEGSAGAGGTPPAAPAGATAPPAAAGARK